MHKSIILVAIIVVHFTFYANCHIALYVNKAYDLSETTEIKISQIQVTQQKESQLLTFCSYLNDAVIENMNFTVYSNADNDNSPNFEIRQEFDSPTLNHVTNQENSIKCDGIELIVHDFSQYLPVHLLNISPSCNISLLFTPSILAYRPPPQQSA
ncbi:MAG: hypothetical protein EZS28_052136 [Streblomastix strix]|uniref:Uncharacterized protein n=1 Tax=Streblomastix strix TaxID=222440 RepID=A0A5J4SKR0_9EUKA|nr:MAG: hypothetical protein EZS28_052136 [Streblomastix strix]